MSTRFLDGPAAGTVLDLARAPQFLRVVISPAGAVDALDLLDDQPQEGERILAYRLASQVQRGIVCSRGLVEGRCRRWVAAEYRLHGVQPDELVARENDLWSLWAMSQAANLKEATRE